jgi:hypothetical protein
VIVSGQSPLKVAEACSAQAGNVTWMEVLAKVLTVSDSVAARSRVDRSGDAVEALLHCKRIRSWWSNAESSPMGWRQSQRR